MTKVAQTPPINAQSGEESPQLTVPPYEVDALFKPFHRLGADRLVSAKGVGLGLSIVQSVAEAHGGTVSASPREDGGLVVTVVLPVDPG
jgi:signal transduction histidine kinase